MLEVLVVQITRMCECMRARCVMGQERLSRFESRFRRGANKLLASYASELASLLTRSGQQNDRKRWIYISLLSPRPICGVGAITKFKTIDL